MSVSAVINNVFDRSGFCLRLNVVISEVLCAVLRSAQREAAASTFCHLTVCVCVFVCLVEYTFVQQPALNSLEESLWFKSDSEREKKTFMQFSLSSGRSGLFALLWSFSSHKEGKTDVCAVVKVWHHPLFKGAFKFECVHKSLSSH